jgi:hypothetical protein
MPDDLEPGWGFLAFLRPVLAFVAWAWNLIHPNDSEKS